jgi:hypothetical protein
LPSICRCKIIRHVLETSWNNSHSDRAWNSWRVRFGLFDDLFIWSRLYAILLNSASQSTALNWVCAIIFIIKYLFINYVSNRQYFGWKMIVTHLIKDDDGSCTNALLTALIEFELQIIRQTAKFLLFLLMPKQWYDDTMNSRDQIVVKRWCVHRRLFQ